LSLSNYENDVLVSLIGSGDSAGEVVGTDGGISIDTTGIDFGEVDTGSETLELITITNEMADDVLIRNLTFSDASYSYTGDLVPPTVMTSGASKSFYVVFGPSAEGSYPGTLTIETDIDGGTDYDVSLDGSAVEPDCDVCTPNIRVTTNSEDEHIMNFLSIYSLPDEQIVSIQNMSDVEMTISDAYLSNDGQGGDFRLSFSPSTIGPWETTSGVITYICPELCFDYPNPVADTNILHIISDDPSESDYQVELWTGL